MIMNASTLTGIVCNFVAKFGWLRDCLWNWTVISSNIDKGGVFEFWTSEYSIIYSMGFV